MTDQYKYHVPAGQTFSIGTPTPNHCVHFYNSDGKTVGALNFNGAELVFTGDADESAKIFIDCAAQWFSERLKQERKAALQEAIAICECISTKHNDTYKHKPGPNAYDPHFQGLSMGADECSEAIQELMK